MLVLPCRVMFHCKVLHHGTSVKVQDITCVKLENIVCLFIYISYFYAPVMDNSDSPSIVEQLSHGPSFSYNTFICDSFLAL